MPKRKNTPSPQTAINAAAIDSVSAPSSNEWLLLAFILLIGVAVRVMYLSRTAVEHFDEGVYASNLWFGAEDDFQYPQRHFYAPPLTPWLIEWTMILTGRVIGSVAIWPSLLVSSATILGVWWLARKSFGAAAAAIAGSLCAVSGAHILLSRAALTDAGLLFWLVLAMIFLERANRTLHWGDFIACGVAVSLAWWTKYNGWLPLFIGAATLVVTYCIPRGAVDGGGSQSGPDPQTDSPNPAGAFRKQFLGWCLAATVAVATWSPYLLALQSRGGYSAVAANHRKYVVGLSGWWESFTRQVENLSWLSGWCNADLICLALGAFGAVAVTLRLWGARSSGTRASGAWLVLVWFLLLSVMTPLYTPYLRLILPWLAASWLLAGAGAGTVVKWIVSRQRKPLNGDASSQTQVVFVSGGLLLLGLLGVAVGYVWEDRTGIARVAQQIQQELETRNRENRLPNVVYVYGEPSLYFQLRATRMEAVSAIQTVELSPATANGVPVPTFLAVGLHAQRDPEYQQLWPKVQDKYELVATYAFIPSPLVLLDNYSPSELRVGEPREVIHLFRMR